MRHLKTDVSHRVKRRQPSIFTARWFRFVLGGGAVAIMALTLGPPVAGWLKPSAIRSVPVSEPERGRAVTKAPAADSERPVPAANTLAPDADPPRSPAVTSGMTSPAHVAEPEPVPPPSQAGPAVYRIQVGAFLNHKNADRLAERLRGENLEVEVIDGTTEERRVLYRVLANPRDGEGYPALVEELRALRYTPEVTPDGAAVTGPVPLQAAVEASRRLRAQGIPVRLERDPNSAALRVVRVGKYATTAEAERGRAELAARGVAGIIVRER